MIFIFWGFSEILGIFLFIKQIKQNLYIGGFSDKALLFIKYDEKGVVMAKFLEIPVDNKKKKKKIDEDYDSDDDRFFDDSDDDDSFDDFDSDEGVSFDGDE